MHQMTHSLVMIFTDGSGWPQIEVQRQAGWDLLAASAMPLMHQILADHYPLGGTIIRAMAARLQAGGVIKTAPRHAPLVPLRPPHPSPHRHQSRACAS